MSGSITEGVGLYCIVMDGLIGLVQETTIGAAWPGTKIREKEIEKL